MTVARRADEKAAVTEAPRTWNRYFYQCVNEEDHRDSNVMLGDTQPPVFLNCTAPSCKGGRGIDAMRLTSREPERWGEVWTG